jgi:hypothetical protein
VKFLYLNSSNIRSRVKLPPLPRDPLLSIVITSYTINMAKILQNYSLGESDFSVFDGEDCARKVV